MHVSHLWRYPVKSLGGEALASASIGLGGVPFDRAYALEDGDPLRAGEQLTARQAPRMLAYRASVASDCVVVRAPAGTTHDVEDRRWLDALLRESGRSATLRRFDPPAFDAAEVLVVNAASLRAFAAEYGAKVDMRNFRANVVLDGDDALGFEEAAWPGAAFDLGDARLEAVAGCVRCVLSTIDPDTLIPDPAMLRLLAQRHDTCFGVYCRVVRPGAVTIGAQWRRAA